MFNNFFGFREQPFKLVPDPNYLFLSRSHEDALAHLEYAITGADGFVEIVGEVGTGKTTICRAFLDRLGETVEIAFILNPILDSLQLMKMINSEFGIDTTPDNTKDLIDILNDFLLQCKSDEKIALLLIDEAQNLSPDVLEQLRLLSNLETTKEKLIKIVLVGQPELEETLGRHELRQLRQRISLSCHLMPLSLSETSDYIVYRIQRVSTGPNVKIEKAAIDKIYKYSGGVPRLINIAANRMLLTAYGYSSRVINRKIASIAIKELQHRRVKTSLHRPLKGTFVTCLFFLAILFFAAFRYEELLEVFSFHNKKPYLSEEKNISTASPLEPVVPVPQEEKIVEIVASESKVKKNVESEGALVFAESLPVNELEQGAMAKKTPPEFLAYLKSLDHLESRHRALETSLAKWKADTSVQKSLDALEKGLHFFRAGAGQNGFELRVLWDKLDIVERLRVPAIFVMRIPSSADSVYLACKGWKDNHDKIVFHQKDGDSFFVDKKTLLKYWTGLAFVPWINYLNIKGAIPNTTQPESVYILKTLLIENGYDGFAMDSEYCDNCDAIIRGVQQRYNLNVDGVVGALTKIALYKESTSFDVPALQLYDSQNGRREH